MTVRYDQNFRRKQMFRLVSVGVQHLFMIYKQLAGFWSLSKIILLKNIKQNQKTYSSATIIFTTFLYPTLDKNQFQILTMSLRVG